MEIIIITLLVLVLVAVLILILTFAIKSKPKTNDKSEQFLQNDLANLRRDLSDLSDNLRKTFDDRLDKTQSSVQFQLRESSKIINDVSARLTKLDETNKRVVDVASELKTLQNILSNPTQRGVFGEYYLNSVLENVLPPNQWQSQYKFKDGEIVDAVIFLNKGKILPIDSKFSLENYNRFIESVDRAEREKLLNKVKIDLKARIDETSKYIRPAENTMDFALTIL